MTQVLGPRALMDMAVPPGVDANEIMRFSMEEGMTPQEVIAVAATTIGEANEYVVNRFGGFFTLTERVYSRYRQGGSSGLTPRAAEFSMPDGRRGEAVGHMLPRWDYTDATEWSRTYLERAYREDIRDDLEIIKERWINRLEIDIFTRMFSKAENLIGQAGYDVGWVIGSGVNVPYIPPQRGSRQFDSNINHYIRINAALDATNASTTLEQMAQMLAWQGHTGRKVVLVSEANLDIFQNIDASRFVRMIPGNVNVIQGGTNPLMITEGNLEGIPGEIFGLFLSNHGTIELRYHERIPGGYFFMTKTYGVNNRENCLAIRTERGKGFGMIVDPQVSSSINPALDKVLFRATHGVGVNDRTNGVCAQIAAGSALYEDPEL
jgi:hypothetical protein